LETYEFALFLHMLGMAGLFAGIGIELAVLQFARRAEDNQSVRALSALGEPAGKLIPVFALLLLFSGLYMTEDIWGWDRGWINISLAAFVVLLALGSLINGQRMKSIGMAAGQAGDGPVGPDLRAKLDDPVLNVTERTMLLSTLGIVYLMATKPEVGEAVMAMLVFTLIGLVISLPVLRGRSAH
jgi:hypothetical protein